MNARDAILWKSGREKVEAGLALTDTERAVLLFYGGDAMLHRQSIATRVSQGRAMKQRQRLETTSLTADQLRFCDLRHGGIVRRTS